MNDVPKSEPGDAVLRIDPGAAEALSQGTVGDPFALLGPHEYPGGVVIRAYAPGAEGIEVLARESDEVLTVMRPVQIPGLFAGTLRKPMAYRLRTRWPGSSHVAEDPYSFPLLLGSMDLYLIGEGNHWQLGSCLGAQFMSVDGVEGVRFAVWAPNARRVSVIGNFNNWDGRRHGMRRRVEGGVWELFVPRLQPGEIYKYEILGPDGLLPQKADPVALQSEPAPKTGSVVARPLDYTWEDAQWIRERPQRQGPEAPLSIYEVHLASWQRAIYEGNRQLTWDELSERLIPYVVSMGYTHLELMPIMQHPFGGSWGYQPLGLFAPDAQYGPPEGLARFVDAAHRAGIGVLVDWVPAHFPMDGHGLYRFDGTSLYEHQDPREGFHHDWNTAIYNFGRREVEGFLLASAVHWIERYHIDGLRVDAVASMLYRDYSRNPGEWIPNKYGGRENLEAVAFLRHVNEVVQHRFPGVVTIAEESTAWPGVTRSAPDGGLGFSYKWNMGWMHDTLHYISRDPVYRRFDHNDMTFGLVYAFSERFVLPISHDEVVHGKGSLLGKMPGDDWQRFANLRAYLGFMYAHPGKKLLFMGCELGQQKEWNHNEELPWGDLQDPARRGVQTLVCDLNRTYVQSPALHIWDCDGRGFRWLVGDDNGNSVYAFYRSGPEDVSPVIMVSNFTPVPRRGYRIGAPRQGRWREILNTDAAVYGGSDMSSGGEVTAEVLPSHGQPYSVELILPPLATVLLIWEG